MSFDLYFLHRPADGNWSAEMDALEQAADGDADFSPADLELWSRISSSVVALLPDADVSSGERLRELSGVSSGIQVSMSPGELSLTCPYWYEGDGADVIVSRLREIATVIESASGLVAYDPQSDRPFLNGGDQTAVASFNQSAAFVRAPVPTAARTEAKPRRWFRRK